MAEPNPPENRNINTGGGNYNERIEGDYIQGNVFQNIFYTLTGQTTPVGNPARPKNERILLAAVKEEVTARLRQSLHNAVLINLGKESQPQQVKRLWDAEIKIGLKPAEPLPDTTNILEVFDSEEIAGKLLILGAPGAGKTTTQLELAQALISRAEEQADYPIPVLFNLSSWKEDTIPIGEWLVDELKSKYGVWKHIGKKWVDNRQLLPMLDGLDELDGNNQEICVKAINQFLLGECRSQYLVTCSRSEEYNSCQATLKLNGAICLQPLSDNQIRQYLVDIECSQLWRNFSELSLLDLARTPLFLSMMVLLLTTQNMSIEKWRRLNSKTERLECLFRGYINQMLEREINNLWYSSKKIPTSRQTKRWLIWLAKNLKAESQTEFLIEKMQPKWLQTPAKKQIYRIGIWLISGLSIGLVFIPVLLFTRNPSHCLPFILFNGIIFVIISELIEPISHIIQDFEDNLKGDKQETILFLLNIVFYSLVNYKNITYGLIAFIIYSMIVHMKRKYVLQKSAAFSGVITGGLVFWTIFLILGMDANLEVIVPFAALIYGVISALISGLNQEIKAVETLKWSWIKTQNGFYKGSFFGFLSGIFLFLFIQVIFKIIGVGVYAIILCLIGGGLIGGIFGGFIGPDIENKKTPNQGIYQSVVNTVFLMLLGILFGTLLGGFIGQLLFNQPIFGIIFGLVWGIILAIFFRSDQGSAGIACIQHFTLRLILYFNGYIPWNYARFLNYCTERMLLQRVGGRYRFIHKLLQDHFAQMEFKRN